MMNQDAKLGAGRCFGASVSSWFMIFAFCVLAVIPVDVSAQAPQPSPRDSWLAVDKLKHFFLSAFIESLSFSGLQAIGANRNTAFAGAITTAAGFAVGKEFYDKKTKRLFSYKDLTWDAAGAGTALVMLRSTQR